MKKDAETRAIEAIEAESARILAAETRLRMLSWDRVDEISQLLKAGDLSQESLFSYADELARIAAANQTVIDCVKGTPADSGAGASKREVASSVATYGRADTATSGTKGSASFEGASAEAPKATDLREEGTRHIVIPEIAVPVSEPVEDDAVANAGAEGAAEADANPPSALADSSASVPGESTAAMSRRHRFPWSRKKGEGIAAEAEPAQMSAKRPVAPSDASNADKRASADNATSDADAAVPSNGLGHAETARETAESVVQAVIADAKCVAVPEVDLASTVLKEASDADGRRQDTAPVNVLQMLNVEMIYQTDDESDKARYAAAAAQASLYDDPVAVVFPEKEEAFERVLSEQAEQAEAIADHRAGGPWISQAESDGNAAESATSEAPAKASESSSAKQGGHAKTNLDAMTAPGAGGTAPADPKPAEGEDSIVFEAPSLSRVERANQADRARKERKKEKRKGRLSQMFERKSEEAGTEVVIPRGKAEIAPDDLFFEKPVEWGRSAPCPGRASGHAADSSDAKGGADDGSR